MVVAVPVTKTVPDGVRARSKASSRPVATWVPAALPSAFFTSSAVIRSTSPVGSGAVGPPFAEGASRLPAALPAFLAPGWTRSM